MDEAKQLFDSVWVTRAVERIAREILEVNGGAESLVVVGLHTHGVFIARRIAAAIDAAEGSHVPVGTMDITLYRDDVGLLVDGPRIPSPGGTDIPFDITDKTVILVDDVLNTGRSIRAALDQLMDLGRARKIQLVGLIDRGGRELPIRPDFVGRNVTVAADEAIRVRMAELDGSDEVAVTAKKKRKK